MDCCFFLNFLKNSDAVMAVQVEISTNLARIFDYANRPCTGINTKKKDIFLGRQKVSKGTFFSDRISTNFV